MTTQRLRSSPNKGEPVGGGLPTVTIYTDGACLGNPGPGGYGAVMINGAKRKELSGGYRLTTNNRMEIMGCIAALEALKKPCQVALYSDSQYVVNAVSKGWAKGWKAKGWMRSTGEKALNPDLWERLLELCRTHQVEFRWVRGHNGDPNNERCDELAVAASHTPGLPPDPGYKPGK